MDIIERLNDSELYVDAIDDAITEIKRLRALTAWRPIEAAPKMEYLLLWNGHKINIGCFHTYNGGQWQFMGNLLEPKPTHWQPLPEPPQPQE